MWHASRQTPRCSRNTSSATEPPTPAAVSQPRRSARADRSAAGYVIATIVPTILLVTLTRYGLLALIAAFFFTHLQPFYPVTMDLSAWYATTYLMALATLAAVALYAFRVAVGGQKVLSGSFLEP